jgi:hypothetical protein
MIAGEDATELQYLVDLYMECISWFKNECRKDRSNDNGRWRNTTTIV